MMVQMGHKSTFEEFLIENQTDLTIFNVAKSVGLDLANKLPGVGGVQKKIEQHAHNISALTNKFFSLSGNETAELFARYLAYISKNFHICIHVTNFQRVDDLSLNLIEDYVEQLNSLSFVFEVTCFDEGFREAELSRRLEYFIPKLCYIAVPPIDVSELLDQIIGRPETVASLIAKSFSGGNGNLRDLERLMSSSSPEDQSFSIEQANSAMLLSRPRNEKILLCLVGLSDGLLSDEDLKEVVVDEPVALRQLLYGVLEGHHLLDYTKQAGERLIADHDSTLRRLLEQQEIAFERKYAAKLLRDWTLKTREPVHTLSIDECLRLLQLSVTCDDGDMIVALLRNIEKRFSQKSGFASVIDSFVEFANQLAIRAPERYAPLLSATSDILLRNNLLSNATYVTSAMAGSDIKGLVCHVMALLSALDLISAHEYLNKLEKQAASSEATTPQRIFAVLLRVWWHRLRGELDKAKLAYISVDPSDLDKPELKAVYLRYAEICDLEEAERYLAEADRLVDSQKNLQLSIETKLALSLYTGEGGNPAEALKILTFAQPVFDQLAFFHRYAIINNRLASENLLQRPESQTALAELSVGIADPFDHVIVENNLLIAEILSGDMKKASQRSFKLSGMIEFTAKLESNILKISYLNLASYHAIIGNKSKSAEMWIAQSQIPITVDDWFWGKVGLFQDADAFVAENHVPFFPPYMTNWSIDLDILTKYNE